MQLSAASPVVGTYDYPEQPGREHLLKTDPNRELLTNGRIGSDGPSAVWGGWDVREMVIDWAFSRPVRLDTAEVTIVHAREDNDASHPHRLHFYPAPSADAPFPQLPVFSTDIVFEPGRLQTVSIDLPAGGLVAGRLRTVFETKRHQVVLAEVVFKGGPATVAEIEATRRPSTDGGGGKAVGITYNYDYPEQGGRDHVVNTDPGRTRLTDGRVGTSGNQAVWAKWGVKEMIIDWNFSGPVRVKAMRATIVHPTPDSENSHASAVQIYGAGGEAKEFATEPDFKREIPFEEGALQEARFVFPDGGIVAERLRTVFAAGRHQVVLSEVSFETEPVSEEEVAAAQRRREEAQSEQFGAVTWLPRPLAPDARVTGDSIFGVCGHFLQTNAFFSGNNPRFNNHWRPSRTLPWLVEGNFQWVREALYLSMFRVTGSTAESGADNRRRVEDYLQRYQDHGVKVMLCPMFSVGQVEGFDELAEWVGELVRRFPAVQGVELHNEPNLKGFWKGTPQEFVDTARAFAASVKAVAPEAVIVAGSFAGWGGAWEHEDLRELLPGPREISTKYAEEVFRLGLLEFADAVSTHPYRGRSAPEGGEVLESPTDPEGFEKEIRAWLDLAAKHTPGGKRLPLYLTEIGYSVSHQGYTTVPTETRQADYITRLMLVLLGMRLDDVPLEAVFWYDLKQDEVANSHYESNFGIVAPNASRPRPAWVAVRRVNEFFADNADFSRAGDAARPEFSNGTDLIKSYVWQRASDGALVVPFWRMNQLMKQDADFDSVLRLKLPAGFGLSTVQLHDLHEDRPRSTGYVVSGNNVEIPVRATARAAWLVITPAARR